MARRVVVVLALSLCSCLQGAPQPLSPGPETALPAGVLGEWRCVTREEDDVLRLEVTEPAPRVYRLRFDMPGEDTMVFDGHATDVRGTAVLSVQDRSEDEPGWYFAVPTLHHAGLLELALVQVEDLTPPVRQQVEQAVATGARLEQVCACVPENREP